MNFGEKVVVGICIVYGLLIYIGSPDRNLAHMVTWLLPAAIGVCLAIISMLQRRQDQD